MKGGKINNYEMRKGGPRKKYVCKEGASKNYPVRPHRTQCQSSIVTLLILIKLTQKMKPKAFIAD